MGYAAIFNLIKPFLFPLLLVASLYFNGVQWKWSLEASAALEERIKTAVVTGEKAALATMAHHYRQLVDLGTLNTQLLMADLLAISERSRERKVEYRDRVKTVEIACPPGADFMDAINSTLEFSK